MRELGGALRAYLRTMQKLTRDQMRARARHDLAHWLQHKVGRVPFYTDRSFDDLTDLPIVDKATLMTEFAAFNTAGITAQAGWRAFETTRQIGPYIVGASTGTSGNRGLFVISQAERFRWLGTILGKALPRFWERPHRVAVLLPLNTPLYSSANRLRRLNVSFFDLLEDWEDDLSAYMPTVVIAPPKVLRSIADEELPIKPSHVFSAAETLDPLDAAHIGHYFQTTVGQIYMATEGLMAVSCPLGNLHLCEDTMHFELPQVGDDPDLREVIISDFSRDAQIMVRYRMNDLVRLGPQCPCGRPQLTLAEIVGRTDDCFDLPGGMITPDVLRNAVVDADRRVQDFRIVQTDADRIEVTVNHGPDKRAIGRALQAALKRKGRCADVHVSHGEFTTDMSRKLRRVEKRYVPG